MTTARCHGTFHEVKESEEAAKPPEPEHFLEDRAVDTATLKELRASYRELRAAYANVYNLHHKKIADKLAELKAADQKTGGDVPYGFRLDSDGTTLIEDEDEQEVIAEAVRLKAEKYSLRGIANELWKRRLRPRPVPKEKRSKIKRRGLFDPTQIRRMIEAHNERMTRLAAK